MCRVLSCCVLLCFVASCRFCCVVFCCVVLCFLLCSGLFCRVVLCCVVMLSIPNITQSVGGLLQRTGGMILTCESEVPAEMPDPVPLFPRQISQSTGFEPGPPL